MKRFLLVFFTIIVTSLQAQNFEELWTDYFSYVSIQDISQGNQKVYVAAENAIFIYDLDTQEIETISSVQGLSGESISAIHFSEARNLLLIGYQNGLIEVVNLRQDNDVLKVVDILDKQSIPPNEKTINHFTEYEGIIYISADFGISEYNLERLEFGDSFIIGDFGSRIPISQTTIQEPYIYASSSEGGIRRALLADDDIIDFEAWETLVSGNYIGVQRFGATVYIANSNNTVSRFNAGNTIEQVASYTSNIVDFKVNNAVLTVTNSNAIRAYEQGFLLRSEVTSLQNENYKLQAGYSFGDFFYMGTEEQGVFRVPFGLNTGEQILPDGPLFNNPFAIDASPGQLWVSFGAVTVSFNPSPTVRRGVSNLKDNTWFNIPHDQLVSDLGVSSVNNIVNVKIDPNDLNSVYFSSFGSGLLNIKNQIPSMLFNERNTPLENPTFVINNQTVMAGVRIYGVDFDREGNLWGVQSLTDDALFRKTPNDQFNLTDVSDISGGRDELAYSDVAISREGFIYFGAVQTGLVGYNPTSGQFNKISEGVGQGNLPNNDVRSLVFDSQNRLWIGTRAGLRVVFNASSFFDEGEQVESQPIIFADEEGVGQELLFEQTITDIEVDGSNNKWIGTATSGVFYVSANGQETLLRFNDENSPLPSNNIQDIAIDEFTGVVYFATLKGLVAYNGTATAPRDNLEEVFVFPNPVRPQYAGFVTIDGLTENANVKITDIEGNLVYQQTSEGGSVQWDTMAFGRYKVASGVYLVLITSEDALETKIKKIMIVR
ncbi:ABC transporter substrate-binding protein [Patiriisocius marinistellae]|uniref:ABC transporter substrate-binding protein n=1 Tax=Patiriisocius marinistellae TaxID=2494560 RepID=A0A5J4FVE8_9FLAO|nr:two-component regulator propeller domain-containing protein [Patiriisocius marinistellae]GEQ85042.1 ABC transporter substrate-binding protein [Patiriisocius marinistellae]